MQLRIAALAIVLFSLSLSPALAQARVGEVAVQPGSGQSFRDNLAGGQPCPMCPEMVVVPAGSFKMGSPANEELRFTDERPRHDVMISRPFAVGRFAVTFDEWDACVNDGGCNGYRPSDEQWGRADRPVINVNWDDAKSYVAWLSHKTGKTYRLLSESEREYVTRAGTTTSFWWGSSISTKQANYFGNGSKEEYRAKTVPVDSFQANPWGLYQLHGNVWEWAEDCYHDSYAGAPSNGSAWTNGAARVISFAAVPGTTFQTSSTRPPGPASRPPTGATAFSASAWRGGLAPDHYRYLVISSGGGGPQRFEDAGSLGQTFGRCGWSRCHGRGSKIPSSSSCMWSISANSSVINPAGLR
jgi:formylglycine-generating enzyme required for sulfatase activity